MDQMTFKALFEHSSIGIIISSEQGTIERVNSFASRMFGYELDELVGKKIEVLLPLEIRDKHIEYRKQYVANPRPRAMGSNLNLMAAKKNGQLVPVEVSLTFFEAEGKRQIVSFVNDITERKVAETNLRRLTEELESKVRERTKELSDALTELEQNNKIIREMLKREKELSKLKSRFVSMASHEFRTPLGGILTSISLISKYTTTEDAPKREKHIQNIKKSVQNLTNILNDFLSLDKLDQGIVNSTPREFNLTHFIDELAHEFQEINDKHQIAVVHDTNEVHITQDKEMVRNMIINLFSNAIKYSNEGTTITIRYKVDGSKVILEIEDQGIGIPEEDQKHLFERFFRAKNVVNLQGTGLGLNIVKRYLDLMDGDIGFTSKENVGTTFRVSLPLEKK
jgi:PAS domain S-box-containing protein